MEISIYQLLYKKQKKFYIVQTWAEDTLEKSILIGRRRYLEMKKDKLIGDKINLTIKISYKNMKYVTTKLSRYTNYYMTPQQIPFCIDGSYNQWKKGEI